MAGHKIYRAIVEAVRLGELTEPFGKDEFRRACPGFAEGTYNNFLRKHERGNGKTSELFIQAGKGKYKILLPVKYGI